MREELLVEYSEVRDCIAQDWSSFIIAIGMIPVYLPNNIDDIYEYILKLELSAVIISGGGVCPSDVSEINNTSSRDINETNIINSCLHKNIPLIGVCRGFQLINIYFGGSITRAIKKDNLVVDLHVNAVHEIELYDDSWRKISDQEKIVVNSFHNDGIMMHDLAVSLEATAHTKDKRLVEAYKHTSLSVIGIQWHPERSMSDTSFDYKLISKFIMGQLI